MPDVDITAAELWDAGTNGIAEIADERHVVLLAGFTERHAADAAADRFGGTVEAVSTDDWAITESTQVSVGGSTLTLEVGTAFGHGAHPTTQLVLAQLETVAERAQLGSVFDLGTGTGVLALAAAVLGATSVVGIDIDTDAVDIARRNAATNAAATGGIEIDLSTIDLGTESVDNISGPFDTVVANMLLADIRPLAAPVRHLVGRTLIVSGILADQADELQSLFPALRVVDHRHDAEWVVLRFDV